MTRAPASTSIEASLRARSAPGAAAPGEGEPIVVAQGLTKVFKDFWLRPRAKAVDSIDLRVNRGEIFGLLGPNGSGKSTTIKMILGLLHKTAGRLAVFGKLPSDVATKKRIGYLPEESYLYPFLNARETLDYYAKLFELDHRVRERRIDQLLDMVGLAAVQHRQVREYSKGMQRRIGIAQALINDPEFLILDEPTTGLDPLGSRQIKDLILELGRRGKTVLLSSHLLADVEDCVDRLVILYGGKIRAEGTCDSLLVAQERTILETERLDDQTIAEIDGVIRRRTGKAIERVAKPRQRLEDLFLDIVERARAERLETSGAQAGGETAAFLRGEEEGAGDAFIERLTRGEPQPVAPAPTVAQQTAPPTADRAVIDTLVESPRERSPAPAAPPPSRGASGAPGSTPAPPAPARSPDADLSIIDSLLGDQPDKPGTEPRR